MFSFSNIEQYHYELTANHYTCATAVEYYLLRIKANERLNAFIEIYAGEALQKARELDQKRKNGEPLKKLHGVVIAIKDVICYKGHSVTAASKILDGFVSLYSATVVERLLEEDAIIIGRCNCDEFAMGSTNENSAYGNVLNAADETKVPGGSSGGSAVAVQAGMCMASLGSDTGGSVRQPADFCGIVGFKPGYGRISRYGLIAYASSFDQIGIFSQTIQDAAILFDVMNGQDKMDSTCLPILSTAFSPIPSSNKKFRIAVLEEAISHPSIDREISQAFKNKTNQLMNEGWDIKYIPFDLLDYIVPAYYVLTTAEASSNLSRYDGVRYGYRSSKPVKNLTEFYKLNRSEGFGEEVKRRILLGTFVLSAGYFDAYYKKAQQVRRLLVERMTVIFNEFDAIFLPTSPVTAFQIGDKTNDPIALYLADIYTVFANLTGIPALSLPVFRHSNGMPFSLQVMTKQEDELTLLQISRQLMEEPSY